MRLLTRVQKQPRPWCLPDKSSRMHDAAQPHLTVCLATSTLPPEVLRRNLASLASQESLLTSPGLQSASATPLFTRWQPSPLPRPDHGAVLDPADCVPAVRRSRCLLAARRHGLPSELLVQPLRRTYAASVAPRCSPGPPNVP